MRNWIGLIISMILIAMFSIVAYHKAYEIGYQIGSDIHPYVENVRSQKWWVNSDAE